MPRTRFAHLKSRDFVAMAAAPSYRAPSLHDIRNCRFRAPCGPVLDDEERRLLDLVIAAPDDDGPRRRYAQWCELQGDQRRADFIRAQLRGEPANPEPAWGACFEPWCARDLEYRRGFVEALSLAGRAFISLGAPLFRMTPLREVRLVAIAPFWGELAATPHLRCIECLNLRGIRTEPDSLRLLAASPNLGNLKRLDLRGHSLGAASNPIIDSLRNRGISVELDSASRRQAA